MVAQYRCHVSCVDDPSMSAFCGSSTKNAAVAATGLLAVMNREELEGVIEHSRSYSQLRMVSTIAVALHLPLP